MLQRHTRRAVLEAALHRNSSALVWMSCGLVLNTAVLGMMWHNPPRLSPALSAELLADLSVLSSSAAYAAETPLPGGSHYAPLEDLGCGDGPAGGFDCVALTAEAAACPRAYAFRVSTAETGFSLAPLETIPVQTAVIRC